MRCRWPLAAVLAALALWPADLIAGATREQALAALADKGSADHRREGAQALGATGLMSDLPQLAAALRDTDATVRDNAESSMWQVWSRSGDPAIDQLLAKGLEQMQAREAEQAVTTFSEIIQRKPEFAEGWNKRATVYYMLGEYQKSLADCDEVMKRNPYHFGALAGYSQIYIRLEYYDRALDYARRALEVNPNMEGVRRSLMLLEHVREQRRQQMI